ncbi:MAG: hypothetical protein U5O39_13030 [Gammaproteobacteria bacterium]|nr:hypothetical protein [Gammaproteobacteria bacterium]
MRILLLSPYDALSHRYWREGLVAAMPEWNVTTPTLPPRRTLPGDSGGNSLALSRREENPGVTITMP